MELAFKVNNVNINKINKKTINNTAVKTSLISHMNQNLEIIPLSTKQYLNLNNISFKGCKGKQDENINHDINDIAGYKEVKDYLCRCFCEPILEEKAKIDYPKAIPNTIVMYGPSNVGKTYLIDSLANTTGCRVSSINNVSSDDFIHNIRTKLEDAKNNYFKTGRRTIIVIDTPEYFIGKEEKSKCNVRFMKNILDTCSKLPKDKNDEWNFASTIFLTTSNPFLLHRDLCRPGRFIDYIPINPPEKEDIEDVLKYYVKKAAQEARKLNKAEGTNKYSIDADEIPYDKIAEHIKPTEELGAYSNALLRKCVESAFDNYKANTQRPFKTHLGFELIKRKRDIDATRYKEYLKIDEAINPKPSAIETLEELESLGLLSDEEINRLEQLRKSSNNQSELF